MIRKLSLGFGLLGLAYLVTLFGALFLQALPGLAEEALFVPGKWDFRRHVFASLSLFHGTAVVAAIALALAFPVGLGAAVFVSEFLTGRRRAAAKTTIEWLAGIPSVVYGLLGVAYLTGWMYPLLAPFGAISGDSLVTAGVLLAVMILPTLMTFADDALRCVPRSYRETGWGLGLSRTACILHVVLPRARAGILGAALLALGRAIGETIAVYLVVGRADRVFSAASLSPASWIQAGQTLTTKLGGSEIALAYGDSRHWSALMALGVCLWLGVGALTYGAETFFKRTEAR